MREETKLWLAQADDDLKVAEILLERGFARGSLFHDHEAIEKLLKAIWIEQSGTPPERTHNLLFLADLLAFDMSRDQNEFLRKLNWQLAPSRYPEGQPPDDEAVRWYHERARELYQWLRQHLT